MKCQKTLHRPESNRSIHRPKAGWIDGVDDFKKVGAHNWRAFVVDREGDGEPLRYHDSTEWVVEPMLMTMT
jgi:hypothetical protein